MLQTNVVFVLAVLISGYFLSTRIHLFHYHIAASNGYHTFLNSAFFGLLIFAACYCIRIPLVKWWPDFNLVQYLLSAGLPGTQFDRSLIFLIESALSMLALAITVPMLMYWVSARFGFDKETLFMGAFFSYEQNPEFTKLLFSSFDYGLPILFTLSDRKVFVGYPIEIQRSEFNDVIILPVYSGYRGKDTLKFHPVTPYEQVIKHHSQEADYEKFAVSIPIREIVHAHLIDFTLFDKFAENESTKETRTPTNVTSGRLKAEGPLT